MDLPIEPGEMRGLLERLRAQDERAQRQFWNIFFADVYQICARILGKGLIANEVTVEVLTEFLIRYLHQLERPEAMGVYLRMMAIRRCMKERTRANRSVPQDMDVLEQQTGEPDEISNLRLMVPRLEMCLEHLTPKAQQVLKLRYFGELTNEKIGQLLGGSKQYIGRLIERSQEKLRECLERKDDPEKTH